MNAFRLIRIVAAASCLFASLVILVGCAKEEQAAAQTGGGGAAPVTVAPVVQRDVPVQINVIGTVEAYSNVVVKSRVSGELQKVHVVAGQDVKAGDILFEIDPRAFDAALHEAQARLDRDKALANNAEIDSKRVAGLFANNAATREEADKAKFEAEAANATVRADEATVENARLQLAYTKISSPMSGRAGFLLADQGNVIKADDTQLIVLNQLEPVYVTFNIPEQDLEQVRKVSQTTQPTVEVTIPPATKASETGKLTFVDNQVDNETGTIRLRATFENKNHRLWPGAYVQTALNLTVDANAIVIPSRAVQTGQQGTFVWVARDDMTVEMLPVKVRRSIGEESVIEAGVLRPGQNIVTDGQLRLAKNGDKIQIKSAPTSGPAEAQKSPAEKTVAS
jgi:multidrug efflux system membrane fusion protein